MSEGQLKTIPEVLNKHFNMPIEETEYATGDTRTYYPISPQINSALKDLESIINEIIGEDVEVKLLKGSGKPVPGQSSVTENNLRSEQRIKANKALGKEQ